MAANYVLIERITVGAAGASSVTFSGIPQTGYTDLKLVMSGRTSGGNQTMYFNVNSDTTDANYDSKTVSGNGSAASSGTGNRLFMYLGQSGDTANTFGTLEMYFPNYTSANYKSFSAESAEENNATGAIMALAAGLWKSTSAITGLTVTPYSGSFIQYTTAYLYGVAKLGTTPAIVPYATGGDTIMTDGTYWYHTFVSSGTFTPAKALTADYLVVAGGGGGGNFGGGGGGAGGLRCTVTATGGGGSLESALSLTTTGYTVTIGAGGAGTSTGSSNDCTSGSNSIFSTITSTGGGYAASIGRVAATGGSGGGGNGNGYAKGSGTANQGYAGGNEYSGNPYVGGGGGGAGAVGVNATGADFGVAGGAGVATSITGSSVTYAGGGGSAIGGSSSSTSGGAGGAGGGGAGGNNDPSLTNGTAGTANRGGGGGGAGSRTTSASAATGAAGGSGIVIVRYAV